MIFCDSSLKIFLKLTPITLTWWPLTKNLIIGMVLDRENVKLQYHLLKRIPVAPRSYDIITTDEQQAWQSVKRDARRHVSHLAAAEADAPVQFPKAFKQLSVGTFPLVISRVLCTHSVSMIFMNAAQETLHAQNAGGVSCAVPKVNTHKIKIVTGKSSFRFGTVERLNRHIEFPRFVNRIVTSVWN